jgi:hypothetical protein
MVVPSRLMESARSLSRDAVISTRYSPARAPFGAGIEKRPEVIEPPQVGPPDKSDRSASPHRLPPGACGERREARGPAPEAPRGSERDDAIHHHPGIGSNAPMMNAKRHPTGFRRGLSGNAGKPGAPLPKPLAEARGCREPSPSGYLPRLGGWHLLPFFFLGFLSRVRPHPRKSCHAGRLLTYHGATPGLFP